MTDADAKVALILALNEDTAQSLDNFIAMKGGDEFSRLETLA